MSWLLMTTAILLASDSRRMRASTARSRKPEANKGQRDQQRTWNFFAGLEEHRSPTGNRSSCIHKIYPDLFATSDLTHLGLIADAEFGWRIISVAQTSSISAGCLHSASIALPVMLRRSRRNRLRNQFALCVCDRLTPSEKRDLVAYLKTP